MLQYVLTALAGVALGIVAMRLWQAREEGAADAVAPATPDQSAKPEAAAAAAGNRKLLLGAGGLAALAAVVLLFRPGGADDSTAAPAAASTGDPALDDVDTMIQRLAKRLEKDTTDGEGFRMLGWSYVMTGKPDKAIAPYKRALELLPNVATVHAGYGEALVGVAGGKVTDEARGEFDKALSLDKTEPRARYFEALWLAQNGQAKQALDQWIELANSGPADAPWQGDVHKQIKETSAKLGVDVSSRLKVAAPAAPAAAPVSAASPGPTAEQMASGQAPKSVDAMVDGLAQKLAANPGDADGWVMLVRSRMVLGQKDQAGRDLVSARKALAKDQAGLAKIDEAAKALGVPGA